MLSPAFAATGTWAGEPAAASRGAHRRAAEALPPPNPSPPVGQSAAAASGWSQLAAAGALVAAACLRAGHRRRRSAPAASNDGMVLMSGPAVLSGAQLVPSAGGHLGFAARGQAEMSSTGRASRIVANVRTRKGMYTRWRRNEMWLNIAKEKHYPGRRMNCFRIAKQAVMHSLKKRWQSRRIFKRKRRQLWIMRVNSNAKLHGIPYHKFIMRTKEANININRKILSQLGVYDRAMFTNVLEVAIPDWRQIQIERENSFKKRAMTIQELDDYAIPFIESQIPELYTSPTIRFNRKEHAWGVEFTVDIGKEEDWRELLPKMPELANFNLADSMLSMPNVQHEEIPIELAMPMPTKPEQDASYKQFMDKVKSGLIKVDGPKKEGVSRDDWFNREPQSWF